VTEARSTIAWLPMCVIVSRATRHLGCTLEDAKLRITCEAEARGIKACGLTVEGWPASPLAAAWCAAIDWDAGQLALSDALGPYEITDAELCLDVLIAADLLPAGALERAWWTAAEALAWVIMGVPLAWIEWAAFPEMGIGMEQAGKDLARAIGEDQVRAQGRLSPQGQMESLPGSDLRVPGFRWRVGPDGDLGTSPPGRLAVFQGRRWHGIEVVPDGLRRRFPKPLFGGRWMLHEAEQLYVEGRAEPKLPTPKKPVKRRGPRPVPLIGMLRLTARYFQK
jgi:hypothetical protein